MKCVGESPEILVPLLASIFGILGNKGLIQTLLEACKITIRHEIVQLNDQKELSLQLQLADITVLCSTRGQENSLSLSLSHIHTKWMNE